MAWIVGTSMSTVTSMIVRRHERGQDLGLVRGARAAVEDEAAGAGVGLGQTLGHHLHDQIVAQQLTAVHVLLDLGAEVRPRS